MNFVASAIKAQKEIYRKLKAERASYLYEKKEVGHGGDISAGVDIFAESIFIDHLINFGEIHSEEIGIVGSGESKIFIDPIDGSDNFLSNVPYFGSSVALCNKDGNTQAGVVCNFANGDLFVKDSEGFRRGNLESEEFVKVSTNPHSKVGLFEKAYANCEIAMELAINRVKFRSPGALALSLAYAHEVNFVLFSGKARDYDIKAGLFMSEELHVEVSEKFILVSQSRENFDYIKNMIRGKNGIS